MTIEQLRKHFSGEIILPNDAAYEQARNTIIAKGSPAVVLCPADTKDVVLAIDYATQNKLILSVRSGGHSGAGFSTNDGGVVIDLRTFNSSELIDEPRHLVRIGAGATWGQVAQTLQEHDLGLSSGDTTSVGVGGLTVGGGVGWMVRKYGLAIDSLRAADVVTADGKTIHVSENEHPELFWAIRGGGGNFGIVTQFEFEAHPIGKVYAGPIVFALDDVGGLLKNWREYMREADEALTIIINILPSFFGNPPAFIMSCCYANDDADAAQKIIRDLKALGTVVSEDVKQKYYYEVLEEAHPPGGVKIVVRNTFMQELSDAAIDTIVTAREQKADMILQIRGLGGALRRVPAETTAFAYRDSEVMLVSPTFLPPTATDKEERAALQPWESIAAFGQGAYSGFMSTATPEDVNDAYPDEVKHRLATVKKQYDPQNIFNQNYNITPA